MKLKFKVHPHQTNAVNDVVDCFAGQPLISRLIYRIDPGHKAQTSAFEEGFKNADLALTDEQLLENIQKVQRRQNLPVSQSSADFTTFNSKGARVPVRRLTSAARWPPPAFISMLKWRPALERPTATSSRFSR